MPDELLMQIKRILAGDEVGESGLHLGRIKQRDRGTRHAGVV
jgi:hypothetical protein